MNLASAFSAVPGWTSRFEIDGKFYGGELLDLSHDPRLYWQMEVIGGLRDKRVLELGPLEAAHTKAMLEAGAKHVVAVEGNPNCWLRCLIVGQVFSLKKADFVLADFCEYVSSYSGDRFDVVSAAGVLYHQSNPAALIHNLSKLTDCVLVWSQVAGGNAPNGSEMVVEAAGRKYRGKLNHYLGAKNSVAGYCGGLLDTSVWLYPDSLITCFKDAGFSKIIDRQQPPTPHGNCLLFVAQK